MTPGEETERKGQDRTVLGDTSRVGDVTGKKKQKVLLLWCFGVKKKKKSETKLTIFMYRTFLSLLLMI